MFELFAEIGFFLPFWLAMFVTAMCLAVAAVRRSYRAAVYALTVTWVAGLFAVPYFFFQYAQHRKLLDEVALGAEMEEEDVRHFQAVNEAAWVFAGALGLSSAAYLFCKPRRKVAKRKSNLEYEYWKAVEARRAKTTTNDDATVAQKSDASKVDSPQEAHTDEEPRSDEAP